MRHVSHALRDQTEPLLIFLPVCGSSANQLKCSIKQSHKLRLRRRGTCFWSPRSQREARPHSDCRRKGLHHNKLAQPGYPEGMAEEHRVILAFDDADEYRPEPPPAPEIPAWKDGSIRIGIHTSIAGDISGSRENRPRPRWPTPCRFSQPARACGAKAARRESPKQTRRDSAIGARNCLSALSSSTETT